MNHTISLGGFSALLEKGILSTLILISLFVGGTSLLDMIHDWLR